MAGILLFLSVIIRMSDLVYRFKVAFSLHPPHPEGALYQPLGPMPEKDGRDSFDSDKLTLEQEEGW